MTTQGGNRAFLLFHSSSNSRPTIGSIPLKTIIKVYARSGETINLGSSANGLGSGVINYRSPAGTAGSCPTNIGIILSRTQELAGPAPNTNGYTPCVISVNPGDEGIWEIDFVSPSPTTDNNPTGISADGNWTQANNVGWVAAWDATVRNSSGVSLTGRVFSNSLALRMPPSGASFRPLLYVQTKEGYQYRVNPRNLDPYTFVFFANNAGFKNSSTNQPLYRSVLFPGGTGLETGVSVHDPTTPDSGNDVTHKVFFNPPDSTMGATAASPSGETWLYQNPTPPIPSNFRFSGIEGTIGKAGTSPLGGSFSFDSNVTGQFQIILDLNRDGIFGNGIDRALIGFATVGSNTIYWDGRDNTGTPVPATSGTYGGQIVLNAGEIHFPLLDAEQNPSGLTIERLNNPVPPTTPTPDPFFVYFDDSAVGGAEARNGVNSSAGVHSWTSNFGNNKGLDTWAYYPSNRVPLSGGIEIREADLEVVSKTHAPTGVNVGNLVTYTIVVRNNGPSDVVNAQLIDMVPASLTGVTWTCAVSSAVAGNSCGAASGSGNNIDTTVSLLNGATATYTVRGTAASSGTIINSATILRPVDITDPNDVNRTGAGNNSKEDSMSVAAAPPVPNILIVKRITAIQGDPLNPNDQNTPLDQFVDDTVSAYQADDNASGWPPGYLKGAINAGPIKPGDTIEYTVYFLSAGNTPAEGVRICDRLQAGQSFQRGSYNSGSVDLQLHFGDLATGTTYNLSAMNDPGDRAELVPPGITPSNCNLQGSNDHGTLVIDVTGTVGTPNQPNLPPSTGPGTPTDSYGFIRFTTTVDP
ncbi:DUF11 domain-containing protein [Lyngbya confervoides]|uniref:DUF11 domain-containing protein n=1 Tax=Lyngbya confervoides BDU141951 TaxID=1574623 RepID=A0ABD4T178_9CYAN|nr:DUF11 domain-containing protein [Lyngbya confervoides]MCM1982120.1 DUF11 domain-containing protein [Lyngbya confervoides BDU141951]